jgi:integrase
MEGPSAVRAASRCKVAKVKHHAALPFDEIGLFVRELRALQGVSARALEFLILTAARTGEAIGTRWSEFDLDAKVWTVPASRMKAGRDHRVPLSEAAMAILLEQQGADESRCVFSVSDVPLSNMALLMTLRRMKRSDLTVHGFRSTFRDWAAECTNYSREVAEAAIAHAVGDKVEAAYRRGNLFQTRRGLMNAWAAYCEFKANEGPNNLVQLRGVE